MSIARKLKRLAIGSTIGIIGGGQLGKMLAAAAHKLGFKTLIYTDEYGCACDVSPYIIGSYKDLEKLREFFQKVDAVTLEFENIPSSVFDFHESLPADSRPPFYPGRKALETSQNRIKEKKMAQRLGIRTPKFWIIERVEDASQIGSYPVILKTATGGYDGKGQRKVGSTDELMEAFEAFGGIPCVAEEVIDFSYEFSVILARGQDGKMVAYEPFGNHHENGILHTTVWPLGQAPFSGAARGPSIKLVTDVACKIAEELGVVGLLAVEMFMLKNGTFMFNEIAPRPHNSGHVTIECAFTSQFEQLIRAVAGWPLGCPDAVCNGQMVNIISEQDIPGSDMYETGSHGNVSYHLYGKGNRLGRKLGHYVLYLPVRWRETPFVLPMRT